VLQQAHHYLNRDTAEQLSSHQNIDSYICQSRPLELTTRKYRDSSDRTWLDSLKLSYCFGVGERALRRAGHCAGQLGNGIIVQQILYAFWCLLVDFPMACSSLLWE
jgi:hypothetical protein